MEPYTVVVSWTAQLECSLSTPAYQIARDALCLSVWRAGGSALACWVTPTLARMVIQIPAGCDADQFITWVRAAASFALICAVGTSPCWADAYTYTRIPCIMVATEIAACLIMDDDTLA